MDQQELLVENSTPKKRRSTKSDSKKKTPKACISCGQRKVKCDGHLPCNRCIQKKLECTFKEKPTKINPLTENYVKLKKIEKVLEQLSTFLEHTEPQINKARTNPNEVSSLVSVTTAGQATYLPDNRLRIDRIPNAYKPESEGWEPILKDIQPKQESCTNSIQRHLLGLYFDYIDPLLPILHKPSFYRQLENGYASPLLLNAMYCVASRWDMDVMVEDEPRGWAYYQQAINLLENQHKPQLSTLQALFLLLKYNEHIRRPGFLARTRYYFQMIIRMCKDIGLERSISIEDVAPEYTIELEKRKRTFWAIYCYDVMMSIESGTSTHLSIEKNGINDPQLLYEEDQGKVVHFVLLTKIMSCQADILDFLRRKLDPVTNYLTDWKESKVFQELTAQLKKSVAMVFSITHFPQQDNMCYAVCFLSMACYFAIITLHRPLAFQTTSESAIHTQYCTEAAFNMKRIMDIVLKSEATEDMYCSIRGIPQIVHYLSAAITVFKEAGYHDQVKILLPTVHRLASISPLTEIQVDTRLIHNHDRRSRATSYQAMSSHAENIPNFHQQVQNPGLSTNLPNLHISNEPSFLDMLYNQNNIPTYIPESQ